MGDEELEADANVAGYDSCPESFILSSCDTDSKADLNLHLEVLSKKSPTKSPFKRIKLKKRYRSNETEDNKCSIQDEIVVKEVMKNLLDKIEKEESQPKNLVFSTLGMMSSSEEKSCDSPEEEDDDDNDNISAYLESSPEPSPAPLDDHEEDILCDNVNIDMNDSSTEHIDESNQLKDINFGLSSSAYYGSKEQHPKIRHCNVSVERLKLSEDNWDVAHEYLEKMKEDKIVNMSKKRLFRNRKRMVEKRDVSRRRLIVNSSKFRKSKRCFNCDSCNLPDCRKCVFCRDMKKYGGKGVKKQSCMMRPKCLYIVNNEAKCVPKKSVSKLKLKEINVIGSNSAKKLVRSNEESSSSTLNSQKVVANSVKKSQIKNRVSKKKKTLESNKGMIERPRLQKYETVNRDNVLIRKNKIDEIKQKFKQQEEKALAGKVSMMNLSREELLFGFYL